MAVAEEDLNEIWAAICEERQVSEVAVDVRTAGTICDLFLKCKKKQSTAPLSKASISDELRSCLSAFVSSHLREKPSPMEPDWNVNVVISNSHCAKSLHIMTEIDIGGKTVEMNLENFGRFRFELARALRALEQYPT